MEPVLQLDDFGLTDLQVHWHAPVDDNDEITSNLDVGYVCKCLTADPKRYKLTVTVKDRRSLPSGGKIADLEATIVGFFSFPAEREPAERERIIRVNGLTMLYGALRGALATVSGLFPPDFRYVLPTVNMLDVIKTVEAKRATEAHRPQTESRAPRHIKSASKTPSTGPRG